MIKAFPLTDYGMVADVEDGGRLTVGQLMRASVLQDRPLEGGAVVRELLPQTSRTMETVGRDPFAHHRVVDAVMVADGSVTGLTG